ncbi:hypothetical protein BKA67DRAFT_664640 [Truncatella angustata]|uniref:Uncharacterized protein n=1 Tax=Truncatella angustata TaxID=152316 RepID=A0A9P8RK89_9PEZI|nr:uncharacterized protein BKA67DRAFT_664640 [Truncatella angustata]KAH6645586.1 hypothetical protein BKA67DRAFT_664640 [Truncatella angustata]
MAEVFGTAASALAVIELAAKIVKLCAQYGKDVSNARDDIGRINMEVTNLNAVIESVRQLLDGPQGTKLRTAEKLQSTLQDGQAQLLKHLREDIRAVDHTTKLCAFPTGPFFIHAS